ncbi:response regulator [Colwellia hornerae]|uniref:Response regulator n=1 Tax=Colwellia hornerae TaxID=89402 RepID=A0A5C6QHF1_9GAMM|nr:response regulator [Colwellia hornerae]TWX52869.1 response regulator [Colwellia hornerae]TWX59223.1 response regulator [Colwellia hornerae]TWX68251.1 response regulator [Colwellia hornerae]
MPLIKTVKSYLTPKEVAELLMVSTATVRLWAENGNLKAKVTVGGHRRFKLDDIKEFATTKNIRLNTTMSEIPKILIVDDDIHFAEFLKTFLKLEIKNVDIEISLDGFDAANKIHDFTPSILLLDLKMPGLNGFQVCERVKGNPLQNHIRVIGISGDVSQSDIDKLKSLGAEACFKKPLDTSAILKQLALN